MAALEYTDAQRGKIGGRGGGPAYFKMQQSLTALDSTLCNPSPFYSDLSILDKSHSLGAQALVVLELELR